MTRQQMIDIAIIAIKLTLGDDTSTDGYALEAFCVALNALSDAGASQKDAFDVAIGIARDL